MALNPYLLTPIPMGTPELNGNRTERQGIAFSLVNSVRAAVLCLAALTGCPDCGPGPDPDTDAGIPDASSADAGRADTGPGCRPDLFNPKNFMACANVDPGTPGTVAVSGVKAPYDRYNGYRVEVPDHATARPATFCVSPAVGANLPATDGGEIVPQAHGVEVFAVDTECPYADNAEGRPGINEVPLLKEVKLLFKNHRGRVLYFDDQAGTLTEMPYEITEEGTLGKVPHLSPFYLLNTDPVAKAAVTKKAGGGSVSFAGTKDEESETPHMMTYQVLDKDGNLLAESVGNGTLEIDLPAGTHELEMVATDPYGRKSSVTSQLIVDPADADAGTPDTGLPAGPDAAAPGPDAAQPGQDAGQPGLDAAAPGTDAAQPGMDAGTPGPDAAQPGMDAAQPGLDAAQPGLDAAAPGPDAAQPGLDAGVDPCAPHGVTVGGNCDCVEGWDPATNCASCDSSHGGVDCEPLPAVSAPTVDCSSTGNECGSWGLTYPVSFIYANVDSCVASAMVISGTGTAGSVSPVVLSGGVGTFNYTTGSDSLDIIRITLNCSGPGGNSSSFTDIMLQ